MNNLQRLHRIVETHQCDRLRFNGRRVLVDAQTARLLVKIYRAVGPETKTKIEELVESPSGFANLVEWAWSKATFA